MLDDLKKGDYTKGEIEIRGSEKIFENKYISIYNDSVIFPGGYNGTYVRVANPTPKSVAVIPITADKKIVIIKNFRHGMRGWGYEVPKGGVEKNETCLEGAERELREETGYTYEKMIDLGEYSDSPAIMSNGIRCYAALNCVRCSDIENEKTEAIDSVLEVDATDFLNGKYVLDFNDSLTELLVYKALKLLED